MILPISAEDISISMLKLSPYSLNALSHDAAANLVKAVLDQGVQVTHVYVDTVGDPESYQKKLDRIFNHRIAFTVSKKADSLFKTVSAASICAKVARDRVLEHWEFKEPALQARLALVHARGGSGADPAAATAVAAAADDEVVDDAIAGFDDDDEGEGDGGDEGSGDVAASGSAADGPPAKRPRTSASGAAASSATSGSSAAAGSGSGGLLGFHPCKAGSGYPGDPLTKAWLRANMDPVFGWPSVVRFSWATCKELFLKDGVEMLFQGQDDDNEAEAAAWRQEGAGAASASSGKQVRLSSFFSKPGAPPPRSAFFSARGLEHVTTL